LEFLMQSHHQRRQANDFSRTNLWYWDIAYPDKGAFAYGMAYIGNWFEQDGGNYRTASGEAGGRVHLWKWDIEIIKLTGRSTNWKSYVAWYQFIDLFGYRVNEYSFSLNNPTNGCPDGWDATIRTFPFTNGQLWQVGKRLYEFFIDFAEYGVPISVQISFDGNLYLQPAMSFYKCNNNPGFVYKWQPGVRISISGEAGFYAWVARGGVGLSVIAIDISFPIYGMQDYGSSRFYSALYLQFASMGGRVYLYLDAWFFFWIRIINLTVFGWNNLVTSPLIYLTGWEYGI